MTGLRAGGKPLQRRDESLLPTFDKWNQDARRTLSFRNLIDPRLQFDFGRLGVLAWCFLKGAHMVKNPEQQAALFARREKQKIEGAIAMNEYLANEAATRRKTKRLRELRLAKEASEAREGAE